MRPLLLALVLAGRLLPGTPAAEGRPRVGPAISAHAIGRRPALAVTPTLAAALAAKRSIEAATHA
jgi:hypothetical protein